MLLVHTVFDLNSSLICFIAPRTMAGGSSLICFIAPRTMAGGVPEQYPYVLVGEQRERGWRRGLNQGREMETLIIDQKRPLSDWRGPLVPRLVGQPMSSALPLGAPLRSGLFGYSMSLNPSLWILNHFTQKSSIWLLRPGLSCLPVWVCSPSSSRRTVEVAVVGFDDRGLNSG